jgi:GAF domain-containing protein
MSSSPTDLRPVFDAMARSAGRLCEAHDARVHVVEGDVLRMAAALGPAPVGGAVGEFSFPLSRGSVNGRAIIERRVVHLADLQSEAEEFPAAIGLPRGQRTSLAVPLLREGTAIGTIFVFRTEVRPFSDAQIALLQTFADQAVIAIENVRLFKELEARNADLTEALEQQTATAEILRAISGSTTDVQPVFEAIAENAVRLSGALFGSVQRFDGELIHEAALHNYSPAALEFSRRNFPIRPSRQAFSGRAILDRAVVHVPDVSQDRERLHARALAEVVGVRSALSVPMLREGSPIGAITVFRNGRGSVLRQAHRAPADLRRPGGDRHRERAPVQRAGGAQRRLDRGPRPPDGHRRDPAGHRHFADRRATGLRGDRLQRRSGVRALGCVVFVVEGDMLQVAATHGVRPERVERFRSQFPAPLTAGDEAARAVRSAASSIWRTSSTTPRQARRMSSSPGWAATDSPHGADAAGG